MRLDLHELIEIPGKSIPFVCQLPADGLDFPSVKEYISSPKATGTIFNRAGVLTLEGSIETDMICICDRCGKEYRYLKHTPAHAIIADEDDGDNPELFLLEGNEVDLDEIISTCFILDMETKFLCSENCKGLCPKCGKDLNLGPCNCGKETDPRFAVLEQLLDK